MDISQQKEQFSNAYVRAVAAVAGYSVYKPEVDDDSIDLGIAAKGGAGPVRAPRLELQLKCTSRDVLDDSFVRYPLKLKNYNDLRDVNTLVPRILVVVVVPEDIQQWLRHSERELCMRHCGYWLSLRGMPVTPNRANVTLELPRKNQFTANALNTIIERIRQGDLP